MLHEACEILSVNKYTVTLWLSRHVDFRAKYFVALDLRNQVLVEAYERNPTPELRQKMWQASKGASKTKLAALNRDQAEQHR